MDDSAGLSSSKAIETIIDQLLQPRNERIVLENGLTVVHQPDFSSALVSVHVWVRTGSIHEGALTGSGLSHFLEHLLFKGTERRDGKQINREVHTLGAEMNAYTTFDRTVYYMDAPSATFFQVVDLLCDCVLHSTLPASEIECERAVILREMDMDLDDPDRQLSQALLHTAFHEHPCREPVIGHRALFEQVTRDELWEYYRARYVPNNIVVSVVGAVNLKECLSAVESTFGQVTRGRLGALFLPEEPLQLSARREALIKDYGVSRGVLAFKTPQLGHPDSLALDCIAYALGYGESSLLWEELRNRQRQVHSIDCRNWSVGNCRLFEVNYICDHEKQPEVEPAILKIIHMLCSTGIEQSVLQKVRYLMLKDEIDRRKTMSGRASRLGFAEAVVGDIGYDQIYFKRLQTIRSVDLQTAAKRYLVGDRMASVVLVPERVAEASTYIEPDIGSLKQPHERIDFANGARLLLKNDKRLPKVHIRCVMLAGPLYEPAGQRGISELMAELLTKGTANRCAIEVATLVDAIGGAFSADGGNNTINLSIEVLPSDVDIALELLGDALTCPVFEESTLRTEIEAQVAGLKEESDEIFDYGFRKLREHFFGPHPFAVSSSGRCEDLMGLTRGDLIAHFNRLVTAPNLVVAVTGDFKRELLIDRLRSLLESKVPAVPFNKDQTPVFKGSATAVELNEILDREQAVLFQAYPDAGVCDGDYMQGEMLNELFSGMSSRLFERVREDQGLAYYIGTNRMSGWRTGLFTFYAGTHPQQVGEVAAEIDAEIARVKAGQVTEEELLRCRNRLQAARCMDMQTLDAWALSAAINTAFGLPVESDTDYARKLASVTPQSIAEFARNYFNDSHSVRLIVGP